MKQILKYLIWAIAMGLCLQCINWAFECMNFPNDIVNYLSLLFFAAVPGTLLLTNKLTTKLN